MITNEWAVRCGCGQILEQPSEQSARGAFAYFASEDRKHSHGPPALLQREIRIGEWQEVHDVATT